MALLLEINSAGRVTRASLDKSSGYPELDTAALRAAERARFAPARSGGTPVASSARIVVNFRLSGH